MARSTSGESVIERTVAILQAFDSHSPVLCIGDLVARTGLPPSTTSRLVDQLVQHGLLQRDSRRRVRIGLRMWELASRASPALPLRQAAMPFMEDLHAVVGQHVQLGVLSGDEFLVLERLSAPAGVTNLSRIAGRLPLHAASGGLVMLAYGPDSLRERVLSRPLRAYTDATLTDPAALRRQCAAIRRDGYALCAGFIDITATGIAVPIRSSRGDVVASLSMVVPNDDDAKAHLGVLRTTGRGLERALRGPTSTGDQVMAR